MNRAQRRHAARNTGLHPLIARGIRRAEKQRKADVIAKPMREMFALLQTGEVFEIEGRIVMKMPEVDPTIADQCEWCEIAPAIRGWIECWQRIAPDLSLYRMGVLSDRLERSAEITPRLIEQARAEFEATVARIPETPDGTILRAITTCQIAWEMEILRGGA